ncbi:arylalkylamine N-acetyltransferase-like 2 [Calliopsis andreniformis]|uniref:arylalkylamine N-acetyltransferase-like 2 n=1 Tax=Calliopsis andreniformis TaxID=337506 RepID=UPI003FCD966E
MSKEKATEPPVPFPIKRPGQTKVWRVVEVVKKGSQEPPIKVSIEEIPEDRYDEVADHMCSYFIPDEPICNCMNGKDDPDYIESFRKLWEIVLQQGLSVGAFVEDPNGGKPILVGCNVLALSYEGENLEWIKFKSEKSKRVMEVIIDLCKQSKVYEKYNVDRYLSAIGLSVHPSYRGAALGAHILDARNDIGREYNIPVTSTAFTSPISQKLAVRCGFEVLFEKDYCDIVDEKGNEIFPGIRSKTFKVMGKRLC